MKNIPEAIYLQIGDIGDEVINDIDFHDLDEVTWSEDKISDNSIKFIRLDSIAGQLETLRIISKTYPCHSIGNVITQLESIQKERCK